MKLAFLFRTTIGGAEIGIKSNLTKSKFGWEVGSQVVEVRKQADQITTKAVCDHFEKRMMVREAIAQEAAMAKVSAIRAETAKLDQILAEMEAKYKAAAEEQAES